MTCVLWDQLGRFWCANEVQANSFREGDTGTAWAAAVSDEFTPPPAFRAPASVYRMRLYLTLFKFCSLLLLFDAEKDSIFLTLAIRSPPLLPRRRTQSTKLICPSKPTANSQVAVSSLHQLALSTFNLLSGTCKEVYFCNFLGTRCSASFSADLASRRSCCLH